MDQKEMKKHKRMTDGRNFYKYQQIFWIKWNPREDKKNVDDPKIELVSGLAAQVESLKPIAVRNAIVLCSVGGLWMATAIINVYCIIALAEEPFKFGGIVWIQHIFTIAFWALVLIALYWFQSYRVKVISLFTDFEENHNFTIDIKRHAQTLEIKPKATKELDNSSQKESAKQLTEDNSFSADSSKEIEPKNFETKINRIQFKDEKPKIKTNQIKPL
jgi:hypothetical protein